MRKKFCLPDFRIRARMVQLGHIDAKGALNYVDGDKIEPFAFDHDAWRESDHTFVLSEREVKALASRNDEFIPSSCYVPKVAARCGCGVGKEPRRRNVYEPKNSVFIDIFGPGVYNVHIIGGVYPPVWDARRSDGDV